MIPLLANPDSSYSPSDCIVPRTEVELVVGGQDLSAYYVGYDMAGNRGQQSGGTIRLKDHDGKLVKKVSQFRQSVASIRSHNQTANHTISLKVTQGASTTKYPRLLPGVPTWDNEGGLSWAVTDFTPLLNKDNQSATDVVWDEGGPEDDKMASDIVQVLATMADVAINHTAPDWAVRTWRMTQENLLSKIDDLCRVTQAYRRWNNDTLVLERLNEGDSTVFHARDRFHIVNLTGTKDDNGLRTFFKCFRLRSQPQALAEPRQGDTVGRVVEITFPDSQFVRIKTKCAHGTVGEGVFYNGDQDVNQFPGPQTEFYGPPGVVANRWVGTYNPSFGSIEYQPWWWVAAEGGNYNGNDEMVDGFDISKVIVALETAFGRRPEFSNLATELIRNPGVFESMLDAIELEALWSVRRFSLQTPFLLGGVREGEFINVTHAGHDLSSEKCLVNGYRHSHSWEAGSNHSYDLRAKWT